uniref:Regulatory P domain of the subtilisin-like proprotein convertase n=1 Tax=Candidatus Kentrum sp. DK TaxID=2126562 RepID=A0A450T827_9GAMM|nr:MAG: Regulatory P domain of the subtilisin-like proprotein convertase [Candidatus Kentron sp. DK]
MNTTFRIIQLQPVREIMPEGVQTITAQPGAVYTVIDPTTGEPPAGLRFEEADDTLTIKLDGETVARFDGFFAEDVDAVFSMNDQPIATVGTPVASTDAAADAAIVPDAASAAEGTVVWEAAESNAGAVVAAEDTATAGSGYFDFSPLAMGLGTLGLVGVAAAAGGGGGGGGGVLSSATTTLTVAPAAGAFTSSMTVEIYNGSGTLLVSEAHDFSTGDYVYTDTSGYGGPVLIKLLDDNATTDYTDETTGTLVDLGTTLRAMAGITAGTDTTVSVTPLTELAARQAGIADNTVTTDDLAVNAQVGELFGITDITAPVVTVDDANYANASAEEQKYGEALALLSGAGVAESKTVDALLTDLNAGLQTSDIDTDGALAWDESASATLNAGANEFETNSPHKGKIALDTAVEYRPPDFSLATDSGSDSANAITNSGVLTAPTTTVTGATMEYRAQINGGDFGDWGDYNPDTGGSVDGVYVVEGRWKDGEGNTGPSQAIEFTLDTTAPTVTAVTLASSNADTTLAKAGDAITFGITYSEAATASVTSATTANNIAGAVTTDVSASAAASDSIIFTVAAGDDGAVTANTVNYTITDAAGNVTTVSSLATTDSSTVTADTTVTVTDTNIAISGATGGASGDIFKIGDTVVATWDDSGSGDNNTDISAVTVDFTEFGGGAAVTAYDDGANGDTTSGDGIWTASYTIVAGSIDATGVNVSVTATDDAGNAGNATTSSVSTIEDLNVVMDITHTWFADLGVSLTSPTGTELSLFSNVGDASDPDGTYIFDDSATEWFTGQVPNGTYRPESSGTLAIFNGEVAEGTWTLTIVDGATGDTGTLRGWSLDINSSSYTSADTQVTMTDNGTTTSTTVVSAASTGVNIDNIAPVFSSDPTGGVDFAENATGTAYDATADADTGVTYTFGGGADDALFQLDGGTSGATGLVTFINPPDFENPTDSDTNNTYDIIVTATDSAGNETDQSVAITVTDVAETVALNVVFDLRDGESSAHSGRTFLTGAVDYDIYIVVEPASNSVIAPPAWTVPGGFAFDANDTIHLVAQGTIDGMYGTPPVSSIGYYSGVAYWGTTSTPSSWYRSRAVGLKPSGFLSRAYSSATNSVDLWAGNAGGWENANLTYAFSLPTAILSSQGIT